MPDRYEVRINGIPSGLTVIAAVSFRQRLRGFIGGTPAYEGILFPSCRAVHTFFMSFPLDIIFLSDNGRVTRVNRVIKPGKFVGPVPEAVSTLEIPSATNSFTDLSAGDRLSFFKIHS